MPEASRKRRTRLAELPPAQKRACLPHSPSPAARSQTAFVSERSRHVTTAQEARPASAVRAFPGREAAAGSAQLRLGPGGSGTALPADAAGLRAGGRSRRRAPKERSSRRRSVPPGPPEGRAAPGPPAPLPSHRPHGPPVTFPEEFAALPPEELVPEGAGGVLVRQRHLRQPQRRLLGRQRGGRPGRLHGQGALRVPPAQLRPRAGHQQRTAALRHPGRQDHAETEEHGGGCREGGTPPLGRAARPPGRGGRRERPLVPSGLGPGCEGRARGPLARPRLRRLPSQTGGWERIAS